MMRSSDGGGSSSVSRCCRPVNSTEEVVARIFFLRLGHNFFNLNLSVDIGATFLAYLRTSRPSLAHLTLRLERSQNEDRLISLLPYDEI
jgi:hypothetical protein